MLIVRSAPGGAQMMVTPPGHPHTLYRTSLTSLSAAGWSFQKVSQIVLQVVCVWIVLLWFSSVLRRLCIVLGV